MWYSIGCSCVELHQIVTQPLDQRHSKTKYISWRIRVYDKQMRIIFDTYVTMLNISSATYCINLRAHVGIYVGHRKVQDTTRINQFEKTFMHFLELPNWTVVHNLLMHNDVNIYWLVYS